MGLIKRNIHMDCQIETTKKITLDQDYNIPDIKPDAQRIVKEQGEVRNVQTRISGDKLVVAGELYFQIMYLTEDAPNVCGLNGVIPFEESITIASKEKDEYLAQLRMDKFAVRLINSRKTSVTATIEIHLVNESICDNEMAVEVDEEEGLYVKKEEVSLSSLMAVKKDILRTRDQWILPSAKDSVGEFLYWDIRLGEFTSRCLENEIQLSGQAEVFAIYLSDYEEPEVNFFEGKMTLEGSISCNGVTPEMIACLTTAVVSKDIGVMEDDDGENRILEAELVLGVDAKVYSRDQLEVITDLYSTEQKCTPICVESILSDLRTHNQSRCRLQGELQTKEGKPLQIWDVSGSATIEQYKSVIGGVEVEGTATVQVMYRQDNSHNPLASVTEKIPFQHTIDACELTENSQLEVQCRIEQLNGIAGEQGIQIMGNIGIELVVFEKLKQPVLVDMKSEPFTDEKNQLPGMVGYVIQPGDTLWDVAKQYYTTEESIREINNITGEVAPGDMVLVV